MRSEIDALMVDEEALHRDSVCNADEQEERAFVELGDLEAALAPDQALLVFQIGSWEDPYRSFDGGSWVFVVTHGGTRVFPLPDERTLRIQRDAFLASVPARDGSEREATRVLYDGLLRPVEEAMPPAVRRWIVVPHGPLQGLPLAPLGDDRGPLVERYEISYVPSASIWWKKSRRQRNGTGGGRSREPGAVGSVVV